MQKKTFTRLVAVVAAASIATLGLGVQAASAADPTIEEILTANAGTITVDLSAAPGNGVGLSISVSSENPLAGDIETAVVPVTAAGAVSIPAWPGPVSVSFGSGSAPASFVDITALGGAQIAVFRNSTSTLTLVDPATGTANYTAGTAPSTPTIDELALLAPLADQSKMLVLIPAASTSPVHISFDNLVNAANGELITDTPINNFAYSTPTYLGSTTINNGNFELDVPNQFATDDHTIATFDNYGRLILAGSIINGSFMPEEIIPPETLRTLPETGAVDSLGLLTLGLGVVAAGVALYARKRAQA